MVIFDCNGVLIDSELLAAEVAAAELARIGFPISPQAVLHYFTGRRPADMIAVIEAATGRPLPPHFLTHLTLATIRRFRAELRATPHAAHALTWLRGPKAVASSSTAERIRASLDATDLLRFFSWRIFSASEVPRGKPAPDLFLLVAERTGVRPADCIVVEDSAAGVAAATAAGMTAIGFVGASHAADDLGVHLRAAGARRLIADLRALKSAVAAIRGW